MPITILNHFKGTESNLKGKKKKLDYTFSQVDIYENRPRQGGWQGSGDYPVGQ